MTLPHTSCTRSGSMTTIMCARAGHPGVISRAKQQHNIALHWMGTAGPDVPSFKPQKELLASPTLALSPTMDLPCVTMRPRLQPPLQRHDIGLPANHCVIRLRRSPCYWYCHAVHCKDHLDRRVSRLELADLICLSPESDHDEP